MNNRPSRLPLMNNQDSLKRMVIDVLICAGACCALPAMAQSYPSKSIGASVITMWFCGTASSRPMDCRNR